MILTPEQIAIINSTGDIRINAVAGSGKTTTVIEYARTRPAGAKILYLAFNKSVKMDAIKKFTEKGINNVKVETAHSLAYRHIVYKYSYRVRANGYKTNEIAELLSLERTGEKHAEYILANHINKFITYFCNSDKQKVSELNYLDTISDSKAKTFVSAFYPYLQKQSRILLAKMDTGEIEITHDFYLKKFQLSNPKLYFDYIIFDEGQDASAAMLDIFLNQEATKIIVGDTHQQIYGWRHAVNSLQKANFKTYQLSSSFRFGSDIAKLAVEVLNYKNLLGKYIPIPIIGKGKSVAVKTKAVLARTNLGLLLKAIEYVTETKKTGSLYFEGNINSYTYADEGASLYDVLSLYNHKHHLIKDKLIKTMNNIDELEDYIEKTEDVQLSMMVEIVKKYENEIPDIIKKIKAKHVDNDDKQNADTIFSTVHRCKGMEYDTIELVNDFISEKRLAILTGNRVEEEIDAQKLNEEINLLYVAITRAKNILNIPEFLIPEGTQASAHIRIILAENENEQSNYAGKGLNKTPRVNITPDYPGKKYSVERAREQHKAAYAKWTEELDNELTKMYCEGKPLKEMVLKFGRTNGAILSRIKKLELAELYG